MLSAYSTRSNCRGTGRPQHFAHGYLAQSLFSEHSNQRTDSDGGSYENRSRFLRETFAAVHEAWPEHLPLTLRFGVLEFDGNDEQALLESRSRLLGPARALRAWAGEVLIQVGRQQGGAPVGRSSCDLCALARCCIIAGKTGREPFFNDLIGLRVKYIDAQPERGLTTVTGTLPSGEICLVFWRDCGMLDDEGIGRLRPIEPEFLKRMFLVKDV